MGQTIAEKILAAHCGRESVRPGEFISAQVDLVLASELSGIVAIREFERLEGARVFDPQKVVLVFDHFTPNKDIASAEIVRECREFALRHGVRYYDVGAETPESVHRDRLQDPAVHQYHIPVYHGLEQARNRHAGVYGST